MNHAFSEMYRILLAVHVLTQSLGVLSSPHSWRSNIICLPCTYALRLLLHHSGHLQLRPHYSSIICLRHLCLIHISIAFYVPFLSAQVSALQSGSLLLWRSIYRCSNRFWWGWRELRRGASGFVQIKWANSCDKSCLKSVSWGFGPESEEGLVEVRTTSKPITVYTVEEDRMWRSSDGAGIVKVVKIAGTKIARANA